jgi:hypothetical protein
VLQKYPSAVRQSAGLVQAFTQKCEKLQMLPIGQPTLLLQLTVQ